MTRFLCLCGHISPKAARCVAMAGSGSTVLGGYFEWCHSSPVLGTAIENRAVELAYGEALISEHA